MMHLSFTGCEIVSEQRAWDLVDGPSALNIEGCQVTIDPDGRWTIKPLARPLPLVSSGITPEEWRAFTAQLPRFEDLDSDE